MRIFRAGRPGPRVDVAAGERLLASAALTDGRSVGGTREAFYAPAASGWERVPWETVRDGSWNGEDEALVVTVDGGRAFRLPLVDPALFLQLFRERVTSSVVLQRQVPIAGRRGVRVVVRRRGDGSLVVTHELDSGLDPDAPDVVAAVAAARAELAAEVGLSTS